MNKSPRYVLDTNVIASALLFKKSLPRQALDQARQEGIILMSREIWEEIQEVLARPKFDRYLTLSERKLFLMGLTQKVRWIEIRTRVLACRDPQDNKFLELGINGKAEIIISGDQDLLTLNPFENIAILTVREFLDRTRRESP